MLNTALISPIATGLKAFNEAYQKVLKNEDGYVFDRDDKGGETYMGIARNLHPLWAGWRILDQFHDESGIRLNRGAFLPQRQQRQIKPLVDQFYLNLWGRSQAGQIADARVRNLYFDFYIHSRKAVYKLQETLNALGQRVRVDNRIGPDTITAINAVEPAIFHSALKQARWNYLNELVTDGLVHPKFMKGFANRLARFPDFGITSSKKTNKTLLVFGLTAGAVALWMVSDYYNQRLKAKDHD